MDNHLIPYGWKTPSNNPLTATQLTTSHIPLYALWFKADSANVGRIYICDDATLAVKATGVHILYYLEAGESWDWRSYERWSRSKDPVGFWLFSDNGTEKVLVTGDQR